MTSHSMRAGFILATILLVAFSLVACNQSDPVDPAGATLTLEAVAVSNNGETDVDVEAHLINPQGEPIAGAKLKFTASAGAFSGAGQDTPAVVEVRTNGQGKATERLHLEFGEPRSVRILASNGTVSRSVFLAQEGAQAVIVATPADYGITGEPVEFDGSSSSADEEITAYRWTITSDSPDPGSDAEEVVEAVDAVTVVRTYETTQNLTVKLEITDDPEAGDKIDAGEEVEYIAESTIEYRILPPNDPPVADAGGDIEQECSSTDGGTVTLDGSNSSDPNSTPGTNDDIVAFDWYEDYGEATETHLGEGEMLDTTFSLGVHIVTLVVTDSRGESDSDTITVEIIDVTPPEGEITSPEDGACFGPDDLPVTVMDNYTDVCSTEITREYDPGPGPDYSEHGDYDVTLTVTDGSGNTASDSVSFTIDLKAPVVQVYRPYGIRIIEESEFPMSILFEASDEDGSSGGIVHERVLIQDCVVLDGWTYGDGDGLLSDESVVVSSEKVCQAMEDCGFDVLNQPVVRVEATDCGGNTGYDEYQYHGSMTLVPGMCE